MSAGNVFEMNRAAWNQALEYHQKARKNSLQAGFLNPEFSTFDRDCDDILLGKLSNIDFAGKTISQMPCNNGRELLSLMRFGAKEAVGFDISDTAIREAKQLAEIAGLNAKFIRTNIMEIGDEYNGCFDFIYISEGSLQWFPDLNDYFGVVSRLLKTGGQILIFEIHPFAYFFENGFALKNRILASWYLISKERPITMQLGLIMWAGLNMNQKSAVGLCTKYPTLFVRCFKPVSRYRNLKNIT